MTKEQHQLQIAVCIRRIAFGDGIGGMERAAADHVLGLLNSGASVSIYTPKRFLQGPVPLGVRIVNVEWPRWNGGTGRPTFGVAYTVWSKMLSRALSRDANKIDLIHFHGGSVGALTPRTKVIFPPTLLNPHGMEEFGPSGIRRLPNRLFLRRLTKRGRYASCVVATDHGLVSAVSRNLGLSEDKIRVIPNAVDVNRLDDLARLSEPRSSRFTIVTVGRLVHNKGYDLLLAALKSSELREMLPDDYVWLHYGSGPDLSKLTTIAASQPDVNLEILTNRADSEVQGSLSSANLFVQPSRYEGSSLTTLEAMTHSRIVVGTAVGGIPDKLEEGVTGFLAPSPTVEDLILAIKRAILAGSEVSDAARQLVIRNFSTEASTLAYTQLYRSLISEAIA